MDRLGILSVCALAASTLFCTFKWTTIAKAVQKNVLRYAFFGFLYSAFLLACALLMLAFGAVYVFAPLDTFYAGSDVYRIFIISTASAIQVAASLLSQKWIWKRVLAKSEDPLAEIGVYNE